MTRPSDEVRLVFSLRGSGLGARRIGRLTGIPVATVQGWISHPQKALDRRPRSGPAGLACGGSCELWDGVDPGRYAYLLGMYLGDGHIVRMRRVYRLSIYCDPKYPHIIADVKRAMSDVLPTSKVLERSQAGCIAVYSYSKHWPCYFPQHGVGMKHERDIRLLAWQQEIVDTHPEPFLRGLMHSDGCRAMNVAIRTTPLAIEYRRYPRYQFSNRSNDIKKMFCEACDRLGVHWTVSNRWTISVSRRNDVNYLDSFIGPKS